MATSITSKAVLTINGKQVEDTFNGLKRASAQLERELKKLPEGTQEFIDKSKELAAVNKRFGEVKDSINATKKAAQESGTSVSGFFEDTGSAGKKMASDLLAGNLSFKTLGSTIKVFAVESWAAIGSIPIIGWLAALAAGIGLVIREAVNYNKEIEPLVKLLDNLGLDKKIIPQLRALKSAFGVETEAIADMLDNLVDSGIVEDQAAALESLKIALAKAPNKGELISYLNTSAETAKKLGLTFEQLINIKQDLESTPMDPAKVFGAMDTFVSRILSQSEKIVPTLEKSFGGDFSKNLLKGVTDGTIKYGDALTMIYKKGEELKISDKERADVAKALFGKSGASAYAYNEILKTISASYRKINEDLSEAQKETLRLADSFEELERKKDAAFNSDTLRAFMYDLKIFWNNFKAESLDTFSSVINGFKLIGYNISNTFTAVPAMFKALKTGIVKDFYALGDAASSLGGVISNALAGNFNESGKAWDKFKENFKASFKGDNFKEFNSFFGTSGSINQKTLKEIHEGNKLKADALKIVEENGKNRETPEGPAKKDKDKNKKAAADKAAAAAKAARDKEISDEAESHKKLLELQQQYQDAKSSVIEDEFQKEKQQEIDRRNKEKQKSQQEIADLDNKKADTKSLVAKVNLQKSIDAINQIEILNEETHRMKMLAIQQKWDAKLFEEYAEAEQRKINESRRLDEDAINNISTMEEAELALSQMKYLKLTDQELRGIKTLEDAKRALREDADRKMLEASLLSLERQKAQLEEALKGMTGEAAEKLKTDLDELTTKITGLKGAINGGKEADAKKVQEEGDAAKDAVDVLGFSVKDWEDCFNNLDTTEGKLLAVGMAFQALSNAGQMFADLTRSLGEKDMRRFEALQNKKKESLLKQLNTGYITNEQYNKEIQRMEAETANKKAEMEYKQAKADKMAKMFSIIGSTAAGVAKALPNLILAGIVGGMGLLQLGIVAAQPLPEKPSFDRGGYTGAGFGSPDNSGFKPAGVVHENEWIAPKWMVENPRTAKVIDYLESVRAGKTKPMADGGYANETDPAPSNPEFPAFQNNPDSNLLPVLSRLSSFLEYLIDNGVVMEDSFKNGKRLKKTLKNVDDIENKNKH